MVWKDRGPPRQPPDGRLVVTTCCSTVTGARGVRQCVSRFFAPPPRPSFRHRNRTGASSRLPQYSHITGELTGLILHVQRTLARLIELACVSVVGAAGAAQEKLDDLDDLGASDRELSDTARALRRAEHSARAPRPIER